MLQTHIRKIFPGVHNIHKNGQSRIFAIQSEDIPQEPEVIKLIKPIAFEDKPLEEWLKQLCKSIQRTLEFQISSYNFSFLNNY